MANSSTKNNRSDQEVLSLIKKSGVMNMDATMEDVMVLSSNLIDLHNSKGVEIMGKDTCIFRAFIYHHED